MSKEVLAIIDVISLNIQLEALKDNKWYFIDYVTKEGSLLTSIKFDTKEELKEYLINIVKAI